ncbi:glycosyl hydrolase family 28-related protein [Gaoshiqia sp. Z1-71]|uniref:glycosyl hydrolase family 28-related protein n=1 Tax=Gaoshiqia hydrogeniformans TaxID=3290090 RepID=UPI003BF782E2
MIKNLKHITFIVCLAFAAVFGQRVSASDYIYKDVVDVKEFGAVGDGVTDDTEAVQKALNYAYKQRKNIIVNTMKGWYNGSSEAAYPMVIFPAGTYLLSNTLVGYREMYLKGVGKAILKQTNPEKAIYYQHKAYRSIIEDLTFEGGRSHIQVWTNNGDQSKMIVSGCKFKNSSSEAIWCDSFKRPIAGGGFVNVGPYVVEQDAYGFLKIIGEEDWSDVVHQYNSTIINIFDNEFKNCIRAFSIDTDGLIVKNCKIEAAPACEGGVMLLRGKVELKNLNCSAPDSDHPQYWIEGNTVLLSCRNSTFNSVRPMSVVKLISRPWYMGGTLIVNNCQFNNVCGGCPDPGIIAFDALLTVFSFLENEDLSGKDVKAVVWNIPATAETFEDQRYFKLLPIESQFHYMLDYNSSNIDVSMPDAALPYVRTAPSQLSLAEKQKSNDPVFSKKFPKSFPHVLYAGDYGIKADGITDDSDIIQQVLDEAGRTPGTAVLLPPKSIKIGKTLNLPASVTLMGSGFSFLTGDSTFNAFTAEAYETLAFKNIGLREFSNGMKMSPGSSTKSSVMVNNCNFYDCDTALVCVAPSATENATLQVINSNVISKTLLKSNTLVKFSNFWGQNNFLTDRNGFFENLAGGTLIIESMLGVPRAMKGDTIKGVAWTLNDSLRWVDNYGKIISIDNRFGGESGGVCAIYNMSPDATISFEGGYDQCYDMYTQKCNSYFVAAPNSALYLNIMGIPGEIGNPTPPGRQYVWKLASGVAEPLPGSIYIGNVMINQD